MFPNYFVILFVPLGIAHRRPAGAWSLVAAFSLQPVAAAQHGLGLLLAGAIALSAARARPDHVTPDTAAGAARSIQRVPPSLVLPGQRTGQLRA